MLRHSITSALSNTAKLRIEKTMFYNMYFDGCSKGNPGISGAGAVIYNYYNQEIWSGYTFLGDKCTNNEAEYNGLILGLHKAIEMDIKNIFIKGDSQLVINQMTGKYKCNASNLLPLYEKAKNLEKNFENIKFQHILRNLNERADELSNIAIQKHISNEYCKYTMDDNK
jgi:ribonuclease HI